MRKLIILDAVLLRCIELQHKLHKSGRACACQTGASSRGVWSKRFWMSITERRFKWHWRRDVRLDCTPVNLLIFQAGLSSSQLRSWSTEHCWIPSVRPSASFRLSTLSTQLQVLLLSVVASLSASRTCSPIVRTPCWTSRRRRRLHGAEFTNESYQSASERSVVTVVRTPQLYRLTRRLGPAATRRPVLSSVMPRRLYPIKEFGEVSTTSSSYSSELHTTASSWRLVRQPRIGLSFIDDEIAQTEPHHDFQVTIRLRLSR